MTALEVAHADAGLDLLDAVPSLAGRVYRDKLPVDVAQLAPPFVLVYTAVEFPGGELSNSLDGLSGTCVTTWYCYCSGATGAAALAVAGLVRGALLDVRPTIAGRVCDLIRQVSVEPPQRNETTGSAVLTSLAIYELDTRPA